MAKAFFAGVRPTFVLGFASGEVLEATASHPFLTMDGWRRVDELALGDRIASVTGPAWDVLLGRDLLTMIEPAPGRRHGVSAAEPGGQRGGIRIT